MRRLTLQTPQNVIREAREWLGQKHVINVVNHLYFETGSRLQTEFSCDVRFMSGSIQKAIIPPPGQTSGHFDFLKNA